MSHFCTVFIIHVNCIGTRLLLCLCLCQNDSMSDDLSDLKLDTHILCHSSPSKFIDDLVQKVTGQRSLSGH